MLELSGEICDMSAGVLSNDEHLSEMGFGLDVTLEPVVVSTLLLADLAVPSQSLKSLGLHLVSEVFGCSNCWSQWEVVTKQNEGRVHLRLVA